MITHIKEVFVSNRLNNKKLVEGKLGCIGYF